MTFKEVLAQVVDWLQENKRISYRALKRQFDFDDEYLEDLKDELLFSHPPPYLTLQTSHLIHQMMILVIMKHHL